MAVHLSLLVLILRFSGAVLVLAFGAMLLPTDWMAVSHSWLGLGEFPAAPLTDYLVRSVAALYGFHGVLVLLVAGVLVLYLLSRARKPRKAVCGAATLRPRS